MLRELYAFSILRLVTLLEKRIISLIAQVWERKAMRGFPLANGLTRLARFSALCLSCSSFWLQLWWTAFLSSTFGPGTYWKEKGVFICKSSEVHRKVINIVVTLSLASPRKEIMNDVAIWKQETLLTTVEQGLAKNAVWVSVRMLFYKRNKIKPNPNLGSYSNYVSSSRVLPSAEDGERREGDPDTQAKRAIH